MAFLEGPACDLIGLPIHEMSEDDLITMLAEIKQLTMIPGGMNRALEIEAGTVAVGKPKPKRTKKATSIDDLF